MAGGRPTKYSDEILALAEDYIKNYKEIHNHAIPSIAGLSLVLDISRDTIHTWAKDEDKPEFSDILGKLSSTQEQILISNGLDGSYNAAITKLVLHKHGYVEKTESKTDLTSNGQTLTGLLNEIDGRTASLPKDKE